MIVDEMPILGIWKNSRALAAGEAAERLVDLGARGATPLGDGQRGERQDPLRLVPPRQSGRDVTADDQEQLAFGRSRMQLLERIDRVGRPVSRRSRDRRPSNRSSSADRDPAQLEPVLGARLVVDGFVRWYPCRDQHHSVELELKVRLLGADEVTKVWRIERSAQDADAHRASALRTAPAAATEQRPDRATEAAPRPAHALATGHRPDPLDPLTLGRGPRPRSGT